MDRDIYQYKPTYTLTYPLGNPVHMWSVQCSAGGIHLHIHDSGDSERRYSGGLEFHFRTPPPSFGNRPPTHDNCWVIGGVCWSDGSSLAAEEYWIPLWNCGFTSQDMMFCQLVGKMLEIFEQERTA